MLRALALLLAALPLAAQYPPVLPEAKEEAYKTVGETRLRLWIFSPEPAANAQPRPAIVFFFGGGWSSGTPGQFAPHAKLLRARGMVAILADYRVATRHQVKADACVRDAKSALRYVRANARRLGIDPNRIAAGGGSAGGHLAAATAAVRGFEEPGEDLAVSSQPNALVLFNPVLVLGAVAGAELPQDPIRLDAKRFGVPPAELSPYHQLQRNGPPTLIFHGEADTTVPIASIELYRERAVSLGIACELVRYPGQTHGFFNYGRGNNEFFEKTTARMVAFLDQLGYLAGA
jgi:acetyl esterase/lipase